MRHAKKKCVVTKSVFSTKELITLQITHLCPKRLLDGLSIPNYEKPVQPKLQILTN
jgi:hypothetical protein